MEKLQSLSEKWMEVCHEASSELQSSSPDPIMKGDIFALLQVDPVLLKYNPETDDFDC